MTHAIFIYRFYKLFLLKVHCNHGHVEFKKKPFLLINRSNTHLLHWTDLGLILPKKKKNQLVTAHCMGRNSTRSRGGAAAPTARNGGARRTRTRTPSTASATCTVAATVQESLWKLSRQPLSLNPPRLPPSPPSLPPPLPAAAAPEVSRASRSTPSSAMSALARLSCTWTALAPMALAAAEISGLFLFNSSCPLQNFQVYREVVEEYKIE